MEIWSPVFGLDTVSVLVEQANRQITRLSALPAGKVFPYRVNLFRFGDALWVMVPGELYQTFQMTLRFRFQMFPVIVATLFVITWAIDAVHTACAGFLTARCERRALRYEREAAALEREHQARHGAGGSRGADRPTDPE